MKAKIKARKFPALFFAASLALSVGAFVPVVCAQTAAPSSPSGPSNSGITDPGTAVGNNSGGTAPAPVYSGPAAASGANSPPVNSGITDPKTGANNDSATNDSQAPVPPATPPSSSDVH
jgi:hypothetical protein